VDLLDDGELAVTRTPKWPYALLVLLLAVSIYALRRPVGTFVVARQLESAQTAEQQHRALCRMNDWSRRGHAFGYSLRALDDEGVEFQPTRTGEYERVATLIIVWTGGSETTIRLLGREGLSCAYHG
jgi:hypothetical protein